MNTGPVPLTLEDLAQLKATYSKLQFSGDITARFATVQQMLLAYISNPKCDPQLLLKMTKLIHELVNDLCPEHVQNKAVSGNLQPLAAHLMILGAIFALSTAKAFILISTIAKQNVAVARNAANEMHGLCYGLSEQADFLYNPLITATPFLKALKQRYFTAWIAHINSPFIENISAKRLATLMAAKNSANNELGGTFHGELIVNPDSHNVVHFDEKVFNQLTEKCRLIQTGMQRRTQFMIYIHGTAGHVIAFDMSVNTDGMLQIICVESAAEAKQYYYLQKLCEFLTRQNASFAVLACQADLQKDISTCAVFAFALCGVLSKTSFEALSKVLKIEQPVFGSRFTGEVRLPALPNVAWFHVTQLGYKAILMCQSFTAMEENLRLTGLSAQDLQSKMAQWKLWYDMDDAHRQTYIDHRIKMMHLKLQGTPFANLTLDEILKKTKAKDVFQALRRLSAGFGPKRLLEGLLIACQKGNVSLDLGDETKGLTAAHLSITHQEPKRACLLLKYGANFDKPSMGSDPKTARELYLSSTCAKLLANPVLKRKLKV